MHLRIFLICTATSGLRKYWSSFGQRCSLYADRRSPRKYSLLLPTNFTWILVCWFFSPQTNMLLFATNQTNLKQKQNFSVFKLCKYWSRMHRWSGIFSCILAVHVLKEAFSVFIVSCLLYLLWKFWVAGKNQNWFPCAFERWVIWGAGRGGGLLNSCWRRVWTTNAGHMLNMNFLGLRRWEQEGGLGAVSKEYSCLTYKQDDWVLHRTQECW